MTLEEALGEAFDEVIARNPRTYDQLCDVAMEVLNDSAYDLTDQEFDEFMDIITTNYNF